MTTQESDVKTPSGRLMTVNEAAKVLDLAAPTIRLWVSKKKLGHFKLGRSIRIPETEINRILKSSYVSAAIVEGEATPEAVPGVVVVTPLDQPPA